MFEEKSLANKTSDVEKSEQRSQIERVCEVIARDMAIVNDERVFHGVTPIVQLDMSQPAVRDVLVLTFRRKA